MKVTNFYGYEMEFDMFRFSVLKVEDEGFLFGVYGDKIEEVPNDEEHSEICKCCGTALVGECVTGSLISVHPSAIVAYREAYRLNQICFFESKGVV